MKPKHGDYILYKGGIGQLVNAAVNQECFTIKWLHNPNVNYHYQPKEFAGDCEVLPKDVAENLIAVLTKE